MRGPDYYRDPLSSCGTIPFSGHGFRVVPGSSVVNVIPFERLWFGRAAGRCNPRGVLRLYAALEKETATAEFEYYQRQAGLDPDLAESFHYATEIKLAAVLDLTDRAQRTKLGLVAKDMRKKYLNRERPPLTDLQLIGMAIAGGVGSTSAILYPSVRRAGGSNLVIFRDRVTKGADLIASVGDPSSRVP